jgi:hypothetical protein
MKYKAIIETDDFEDFEFYEDGNGKYMVVYDATGVRNGGWIPLYFTEYENEPDKSGNYEKDINDLKEQILKDGDTLVSKRDLLERFCEMDKEYNSEPWNLLQILSNINILIGEEPCEDAVSRISLLNKLDDCYKEKIKVAPDNMAEGFMQVEKLIMQEPSVTPTRKKGKWIFSKTIFDKHGFTVECWSCHKKWKTYDEIRWKKENKFCPNCGWRNED